MTKIEWTDVTWNPVRGCSRVSAGCEHCYAERQAFRFRGPGLPYEDLVHAGSDGKPHWTGEVVLDEAKLLEPLHWRKPRRVFVNSMSDLFHEGLTDEQIGRVFAVMAQCPQHTFQVLTKRAERMREVLCGWKARSDARNANYADWMDEPAMQADRLFTSPPLPNVWLGVSAEDQATAAARIPELLATPAAVRFASLEPLLGAVDLDAVALRYFKNIGRSVTRRGTVMISGGFTPLEMLRRGVWGPGLDWVIVGGESGPGARPMHPDWPRQVRDQCAAAGVAFFFKQWGEWARYPQQHGNHRATRFLSGGPGSDSLRDTTMVRVGKRAAGRLLDGRLHDAWPAQGGVAE